MSWVFDANLVSSGNGNMLEISAASRIGCGHYDPERSHSNVLDVEQQPTEGRALCHTSRVRVLALGK
jgi:hypothetical protein